jgi:hypothetical protein
LRDERKEQPQRRACPERSRRDPCTLSQFRAASGSSPRVTRRRNGARGDGSCGDGRLRPSGGPSRIGPPGFDFALDPAEAQGPKPNLRRTEYRGPSTEYCRSGPPVPAPFHHRALCIPPPTSVKRSRQDGGPTAICRRTLCSFLPKIGMHSLRWNFPKRKAAGKMPRLCNLQRVM